MRLVILPIMAVVMTGCASPPEPRVTASPPVAAADPIDQLVVRLSSNGMWQNGLFKPIDLPSSASPEEVIAQVDQKTGLYQNGKITSYQIVEIRQIQIHSSIRNQNYTAVILDTNLGRKITLLQYQGSTAGWWSRVYDK